MNEFLDASILIMLACIQILVLWSLNHMSKAIAQLQRRETEREFSKVRDHDRRMRNDSTYRFCRFWTRQAVERLDREGKFPPKNMSEFENVLAQDIQRITWAAKKHGLISVTTELKNV